MSIMQIQGEFLNVMQQEQEQRNTKPAIERLAYSIGEVSKQTTLSKAFLRNEISEGRLNIIRRGRRVLILRSDLMSYLKRNEK